MKNFSKALMAALLAISLLISGINPSYVFARENDNYPEAVDIDSLTVVPKDGKSA